MPLSIEHVPLASLTEDPRNARLHPDRNVEAICTSLRRHGQVEPLVVQASTGRVLGGNGRLLAMRRLGWAEAAVVRVDVPDGSAADALSLALNRTAELAEWDDAKLAGLLREIAAVDVPDFPPLDLADLGWDPLEVSRLVEPAPAADPRDNLKAGLLDAADWGALAPTEEETSRLRGRAVLVEFSGGKDSTLAALWCCRFLPEAETLLLYVDLGCDHVGVLPHLVEAAEALGCPLEVLRAERSLQGAMLARGEWPQWRYPYCQRDLLFPALDEAIRRRAPEGCVVVRGGRATQKKSDKRRAETRFLAVERNAAYLYFQPLYFLASGCLADLLVPSLLWPGYARGLGRTACRLCPGQTTGTYAVIRRAFPDVWAELIWWERRLGPGCWQPDHAAGGGRSTFGAMADRGDAAAAAAALLSSP